MHKTPRPLAALYRATTSIIRNNKSLLLKVGAILFALLLWEIAALIVHQPVLLPTPIAVLLRAWHMPQEAAFFRSVWYSLSRITLGFLGALIAGSVLGALAARYRLVEILLFPFTATVRSVPVASFVVIALIWFTSSALSVFISFLIVLPIVYQNVKDGFSAVDKKELEMARVYRVPPLRTFRIVYLSKIKPFFLAACHTACGLAWKSGVAAEIIGIPNYSMGERLYMSQLTLDTVSLLAWTFYIVLLSVLFEKLFLFLTEKLLKRLSRV